MKDALPTLAPIYEEQRALVFEAAGLREEVELLRANAAERCRQIDALEDQVERLTEENRRLRELLTKPLPHGAPRPAAQSAMPSSPGRGADSLSLQANVPETPGDATGGQSAPFTDAAPRDRADARPPSIPCEGGPGLG